VYVNPYTIERIIMDKGFTLLELLIVIAILSAVATVLIGGIVLLVAACG